MARSLSKSIIKINGRPIRHTLGKYPDLAIERARKMANEKLAEIAKGSNPNDKRRAQRNAGISVKEVFADYLAARCDLKPGTIHDYNRLMISLVDVANRPLRDVDKESVATLHGKLGKTYHPWDCASATRSVIQSLGSGSSVFLPFAIAMISLRYCSFGKV